MRKKYDLRELELACKEWDLEEGFIVPEKDREKYEMRKTAVKMYANGEKLVDIEVATGVKGQNINRLISRCYEHDQHDKEYGFRALIPYTAVKARAGRPSTFMALYEKHKAVFDKVIRDYFLSDNGFDRMQSKRFAFISLLRELRQEGLDDLDYPFTLEDLGRRSFSRFLDKVEQKTENGLFLGRLSDDARQHINATIYEGGNLKLSPLRPVEKVEIDGHKIDGLFTISFIDVNGDERIVVTERIFIVTAIDVSTRAIVGCAISLNANYNRTDVLKCIKGITIPPELNSGEKPYLLSQLSDDARYMLPAEISIDNANANLAGDVISPCLDLGIAMRMGPVAKPTGRPFIERDFRTLEENGFHRLPNTTGSSPNDNRRNDPEKHALTGRISLEHLRKLTQAVIYDYNNSPHTSLKGFSPLEMFTARIKRGMLPTYLPKENAEARYYLKEEAVVRSYVKSGSAPAINIFSESYTSPKLKGSYEMTGKTLILAVDPDDVSHIDAYTEDGEFYDTLNIIGQFRNRKVSLHQLELLGKCKKTAMRNRDKKRMTVDDVLDEIKEESKRSKRAATRYAALQDLDTEGYSGSDNPVAGENPEETRYLSGSEVQKRKDDLNRLINGRQERRLLE